MHVRRLDTESKKDVQAFVQFAFDLYQECPQWVPPLVPAAQRMLDRNRHPFYQHSTADFFLAEHNGQVLGRIAVIHNRNYNRYRGRNEAFYGLFESRDDGAVAGALFDAAFDWAWKRGLDGIVGPRGIAGLDGVGTLVEGFEHRPALGVAYNYPYYQALIEEAGFVKDTDFLSGYVDTSYQLPERVYRIAEKIQQRSGYRIKSFASKAEMRQWIPRALAAHHRAFADTHTFYPPTDAEVAMMVDMAMLIIDPRLVKLIMQEDRIVGFVLAYHDVSAGLQQAKGRLWPTGWWHILRERQRTRWVNLSGLGLVPEHQGLGATALLYLALDQTLRAFPFQHADLVQSEEGNHRIIGEANHMGVTWYKRHRSYKRAL